MNLNYWWGKAKEASAIVGWYPTVILAQWQHETGNFCSSNFLYNNNIAGQTWQPYMPESIRGTARPKAEGGFYIRYDDPVTGYVDFIQKNGRYSKVKLQETEEGQIRAIAAAGWAVDTKYAEKVIKWLNNNKAAGILLEDDDMGQPMKFEDDWQWTMLGDALDGLCKKGLIEDYKWAEKAYTRALTQTELSWLNMVVYARQNGIKVEVRP